MADFIVNEEVNVNRNGDSLGYIVINMNSCELHSGSFSSGLLF